MPRRHQPAAAARTGNRAGRSAATVAGAVVAALTTAACTALVPTAEPGAPAEPEITAVSADGLSGFPRRSMACPSPETHAGRNEIRLREADPITGTVVAFRFCRRGWLPEAPAHRRLTMSDAPLVARVAAALSAPDQRPAPWFQCHDVAAPLEPPVTIRTSDGVWLVRAPYVNCGTALDGLAIALTTLDDP